MALRFEGFDGTNLKTARAIMLDARSVVEKAQKQLSDKSAKAGTSTTTWFGTLSEAQQTELASGLHGMFRAWTRPSFKIEYGTNCAVGENARVQHFKKTQGDVQTNTFGEAQAGVVHAMTLCPSLFSGRSRAKQGEQSQVQVVLHELSHYGAGTVDVEYSDAGVIHKCYETTGAKKAKSLGKAFENAENWGFFLMEFYNLITPH